jgi:hypothetical protein
MASARRVRGQKFPQTQYDIDLAEALEKLLRNNDFAAVLPSDQWYFQVVGDKLVITKIAVAETVPE